MAENSADNVEENVATNGESAVKTEGNPWDSPRQNPVNGIVQPRTVPPPDKPTRHTNQLEYLYNHILKDAFKKKLSWPFRAPVNAVELDIPDYHKVIAKPMDLNTIMARVKNVYYYSANEAVQDVMLMFTNCYTFNPPEYGVCQMAKQLEEFVLGRLHELPETEEEIEKTTAKRGPKGKKKFPSSKNLTNSNKIKDELEPEFLHVIDHFHRATRALMKEAEDALRLEEEREDFERDENDERNSDTSSNGNDSLSRESSVVSIQQKDADSSIVDTHDDNEPMASTSSIPDVSALSSNSVGGVKRKADTTTIDDDSSAKIGSRRESSRPIKKPSSFFDYTTGLTPTPTPTPQGKNKKPDVMKFCLRLLNELHSKKYKDFMWPFYLPVDVEGLKLTDYYDVISHPMDLSTVRKNLEQKEYSSAQEFAEDIRLISRNCCTYNPVDSEVHKHGVALSKLFEIKFRECPAEDDYSDAIPLSVQTDLNDDEKFNSVMSLIKTEQKKASERVDDLRALHERMYEVLIQRRESKLNGTLPPAIDNTLLSQIDKLGIPIETLLFNDQSMAADELISPTTSIRSSSRAPVPKIFDDIRMEPSIPKPAPVKKSISRPSVPPPADIVAESPKPAGPRRGRRPGSKNRPKELIGKKVFQFDSDDELEPLSYDDKIALSQQIQALDTTLVAEVIRIIEKRKAPETINRDEMEIDFDQMEPIVLHELRAFVNHALNKDKKPKKMMPIKNAADAEKKKLEIQAELQVLNSTFPNLNDISANKPQSKPSSSQPPAAKKQRVIASESSSSGSDSSSSSSSDSDSEGDAGPRSDELSKSSFTSLMKSSDFVKSIASASSADAVKSKSPVVQTQPSEAVKAKSPSASSPKSSAPVKKAAAIRKKSNTPKTRETTPHSRTSSPACLDSAKLTETKELGSSPADILARSYVHPSGHAKIENMKKIHPTGHASISILDQILPDTATFEPPNREKLAKEAREKELREAEAAKQRRLEWEQQSAQQKADDEALMLRRQAEARRKRQMELADTVGINQQQELMFNFETSF